MEIAALFIAGAAVVIAVAAFAVSWRQSGKANEIAGQALTVAERADDREAARYISEHQASVSPDLWDEKGDTLHFKVAAAQAIAHVEVEFRLYSGEGGKYVIERCLPTPFSVMRKDFVEESLLPTPGAKEILASARWRNDESADWQESGTWMATKDQRRFRRVKGSLASPAERSLGRT